MLQPFAWAMAQKIALLETQNRTPRHIRWMNQQFWSLVDDVSLDGKF
jgi:hypothetical protein